MDKYLLISLCFFHCGILAIAEALYDDVYDLDLMDQIDEMKNEMQTVEKELNFMKRNFSAELENVKSMIRIDPCKLHPCEYGGRCVNLKGVNMYKCICKKSQRGHRCQYCAHGFLRVGTYCVFREHSFSHRLKAFGNSYYIIGKEKKTFEDARETCHNIGGDLASLETNEEWEHVYDLLLKHDKHSMHWLGATGDAKNGWKWLTGTPIIAEPMGTGAWRRGQPNLDFLSQNDDEEVKGCLVSNWPKYSTSDDNWWDNKCQTTARFICEFTHRF